MFLCLHVFPAFGVWFKQKTNSVMDNIEVKTTAVWSTVKCRIIYCVYVTAGGQCDRALLSLTDRSTFAFYLHLSFSKILVKNSRAHIWDRDALHEGTFLCWPCCWLNWNVQVEQTLKDRSVGCSLRAPHSLPAHPEPSQHHHPRLSPGVQQAFTEWIDTLTLPQEVCARSVRRCIFVKGR